MENQPENIIAIGRKRVPVEEIALVEPFEPPAEQPPPRFTSGKHFKARVVLIDRYNVLTEDTVEVFAEANKFRRLPQDNVATNPAVRFRVETFEPSEGFQPRKPYQSRLKWRDQDGATRPIWLRAKNCGAASRVAACVPSPDGSVGLS
jgi:hypothetical protein